MPRNTGNTQQDKVYDYLLNHLKAHAGDWFWQKDLKELATEETGVRRRTVDKALMDLHEHEEVLVEEVKGQGKPKRLRYEARGINAA